MPSKLRHEPVFGSAELPSEPTNNDRDSSSLLRSLPSVDALMSDPSLVEVSGLYPRTFIVDEVRRALATVRASIRNGGVASVDIEIAGIVKNIVDSVESRWGPSPTRVINATGVIIHTNLGRAQLSNSAVKATQRVALGYSDLEYDIATAGRGSRHSHV
ncbi:MAG: hypothetical protein F4Y88_04930, partial [Chloroflexi bacterium]|nr:hypothetical protein [Chloroflexota bacterium]